MTIYEWLDANNIKPENLDEIVHDAAADMASNSNNEGIKGQIAFLTLIAGWSEDNIKEMLLDSVVRGE